MIGIYLITNKVNGKVYIGQSSNINRRIKQHVRSAQPEKYSIKNKRDTKTPIHLAMQKYSIQNFSFSILEECSIQELNEKERYWIKLYKSNNSKFGYNLTEGGQQSIGVKGEHHSQAKLTQKEVDQIKNLLKHSSKNLNEILELYPFISKSTLSMINQGKTWHDDSQKYPLRILQTAHKGSLNGRAKFTEQQVMEIRIKYSKGSRPKDLFVEYGHIASESAISSILYGKTYRHLPIWNNTQKKWIEPCIDYPQSLK